jgi:hypothetical protein
MRARDTERRSRIGIALVASIAFLTAAPARAEVGAVDVVPAATLLLPYFEVEVPGEANATPDTVLTIMNTSPAPTLAHLVLWTDYGVPTVSEDIFLTGFDVETISLRVQLNGAGAAVINAHRGRASALFDGLCSGFDHGDALARGYVTIDNVQQESKAFPTEDGYFASNGTGVASNTNQLWGQYVSGSPRGGILAGAPLVHIEAADEDNVIPVTFYARETNFDTADQRERLSSSWGLRYWHGLTDLICWRDDARRDPFPCPNQSTAPTPLPLELVVFDHAENPLLPEGGLAPCHLAAGRVRVGGALLPVIAKTGWIFANVNPQSEATLAPRGFIIPPPQAYFTAHHTLHPGGLGAGSGGVALDGVEDGLAGGAAGGPAQ